MADSDMMKRIIAAAKELPGHHASLPVAEYQKILATAEQAAGSHFADSSESVRHNSSPPSSPAASSSRGATSASFSELISKSEASKVVMWHVREQRKLRPEESPMPSQLVTFLQGNPHTVVYEGQVARLAPVSSVSEDDDLKKAGSQAENEEPALTASASIATEELEDEREEGVEMEVDQPNVVAHPEPEPVAADALGHEAAPAADPEADPEANPPPVVEASINATRTAEIISHAFFCYAPHCRRLGCQESKQTCAKLEQHRFSCDGRMRPSPHPSAPPSEAAAPCKLCRLFAGLCATLPVRSSPAAQQQPICLPTHPPTLDFLNFIPPQRVRAVLSAPLESKEHDPICTSTDGRPTPLQIATKLRTRRVETRASIIVLAAQQPWCPKRHSLFPVQARAAAADLVKIGFRLSRSPKWESEAQAMMDVWTTVVMPFAISRTSGCDGGRV